MKKFILCMSIAAALLSGTAALAADASYDADSNAVSGITGDTYKTVLITKDGVTTDDGIVYVGQTESGTFAASTQFLLKENPADGYYTVSLGGGESGTPATMSFYIGEIPVTPDNVTADKTFYEADTSDATKQNVAFGWESVEGSSIKSIVLTIGDKTLGHNFTDDELSAGDIPVIAEGSPVNLGVKISGIPANTTASAYLSSKTLTFKSNDSSEGGNE